MKAFVEFGRETSNTKSSSHAEFKTWLKMVPQRSLRVAPSVTSLIDGATRRLYLTGLVFILLPYFVIRL